LWQAVAARYPAARQYRVDGACIEFADCNECQCDEADRESNIHAKHDQDEPQYIYGSCLGVGGNLKVA